MTNTKISLIVLLAINMSCQTATTEPELIDGYDVEPGNKQDNFTINWFKTPDYDPRKNLINMALKICIDRNYLKVKINDKPRKIAFETWALENFTCLSQNDIELMTGQENDRKNTINRTQLEFQKIQKNYESQIHKSDNNYKDCIRIAHKRLIADSNFCMDSSKLHPIPRLSLFYFGYSGDSKRLEWPASEEGG